MKFICYLVLIILCNANYAFSVSKARLLDDPEDAYHTRLNLIMQAKSHIYISYFIFGDDEAALNTLALLRQKAREGVEVRLLVDAPFNKIPRYIGTHLIHEGIKIKNYKKINVLKPLSAIKYRMHDKIFIVDNEWSILGGRNIENSYYQQAEKNYTDRDILVQGDLNKEIADYYEKMWQADHLTPFKIVKKTSSINRGNKLLAAEEELDLAYARKNLYFEQARPQNFTSFINVENMSFLHDPIAKKKSRMAGHGEKLFKLMRNAKKSILIDSPYLVPTRDMIKLFEEIIAKGVKIRILTNSLMATDGLLPQSAYLNYKKRMVRMGIDLFEYIDDNSFHSKSMVIDDEISIVGSFNFDPRSLNLNTETSIILEDIGFAQALTQSMNDTLESSHRVLANGKLENKNKKYPYTKLGKRIVTKLLQFLVAPWVKGLL